MAAEDMGHDMHSLMTRHLLCSCTGLHSKYEAKITTHKALRDTAHQPNPDRKAWPSGAVSGPPKRSVAGCVLWKKTEGAGPSLLPTPGQEMSRALCHTHTTLTGSP